MSNRKYCDLFYSDEAGKMMYEMNQEGLSLKNIGIAFQHDGKGGVLVPCAKSVSFQIERHVNKLRRLYDII